MDAGQVPTMQTSQPNIPVPAASGGRMVKILAFVLLLVSFFAAGAAAFWYYQKNFMTPSPTPTSSLLPKPSLIPNEATGSASPSATASAVPTSSPLASALASPTTSNLKTYKNDSFKFTLNYPADWTVNTSSQNFKEGDLFNIYEWGPTQKPDTEFYDGGMFVIGTPIKTTQDIVTWAKAYYGETNLDNEPNQFSTINVGSLSFYKVYTCGLGCFSYYNTKKGDSVFRFLVMASGPQEEKYKQLTNDILASFKFTQ